MSTFKEKVRFVFKALVTALLFSLQSIVYGGWAISVMFVPLLLYLVGIINDYMRGYSPNLERDVHLMFFARDFIVGRVIAVVGFAIFFVAAFQFLREHKKAGLIKTGLYSVVRHPQYLGIIIITIGLNVMVFTRFGSQPKSICLWLVQVAGYIGLAKYEERRLEKKFSEHFRNYKNSVPFMFPIKAPSKIPETLFTLLIAFIISLMFLTFPFHILRIV
ncbi:MAG: methyltransferase family protein [Candidatus Bathyarchaeia archaeon]